MRLNPEIILIIGGAIMVGILVLAIVSVNDAESRCATIGATYKYGRDFGACVKDDGSMWRVPR